MPTPLEAMAGVANAAQPVPNLLTGGQPTEAHLVALKQAGVELVLDIRDPMEPRPYDEPAAAKILGLRYANVPVSAGRLDDSTMERILGVVRENSGKPILFHCASGNRVGGPLIAHLMLDLGMNEDHAIEHAVRGGLRGAEILEWGVEYATRKLEEKRSL